MFRNINFVRHLIRFILCFDRRNGLMVHISNVMQYVGYVLIFSRTIVQLVSWDESWRVMVHQEIISLGESFNLSGSLMIQMTFQYRWKTIETGPWDSLRRFNSRGKKYNNYGEKTRPFPNWPLNTGSNVVRLVFSPKNLRRNTCFSTVVEFVCFSTVVEFVCFCAYWTFSKNDSNSFLLK